MAPGRRALVLFAMVAIAVAIEAAWLAPAALLGPHVARTTGGVLRLTDAEGTVRHGHGSVVAGTARIPIAWRVEIWPLLRGVVRLQVTSGTGAETPRATIAASADTVAFHDVDVTIPAAAFAAALGQAAVGLLAGEVNLTAAGVELTPGSSRGDARFAWHAARIAIVGNAAPLDLGEVRATLTAGGDTLSGSIDNDGGDLALRGEWAIRPDDGLRLALLLTPRRAGQAELAGALAAIGTADGTGWRVEWRVPLR
jgi:hypothetical protein